MIILFKRGKCLFREMGRPQRVRMKRPCHRGDWADCSGKDAKIDQGSREVGQAVRTAYERVGIQVVLSYHEQGRQAGIEPESNRLALRAFPLILDGPVGDPLTEQSIENVTLVAADNVPKAPSISRPRSPLEWSEIALGTSIMTLNDFSTGGSELARAVMDRRRSPKRILSRNHCSVSWTGHEA